MLKYIFKLIRWQNLLIIAVSMSFIRYLIILPALHLTPENGMDITYFVLLVVSTLLIAAGGYILNDITDMETDRINKPAGKNIVGTGIAEKQAFLLYGIFTITGVVGGTLLSVAANHASYSLIFILTAGLLWFYAKRYECQPVIGNIVVAFLSALSFGLVWLYEFLFVFHKTAHAADFKPSFMNTSKLILIYMTFAFVVSWVREIVKDIEDYKGDDRFGCRTFAVVYGTGAAKIFSIAVLILGTLFSGYVQYLFYQMDYITVYYFCYVIDILFVANIVRLIKIMFELSINFSVKSNLDR